MFHITPQFKNIKNASGALNSNFRSALPVKYCGLFFSQANTLLSLKQYYLGATTKNKLPKCLFSSDTPKIKPFIDLTTPLKTEVIIIFLDIDGVIFYNPMNGMVQNRVKERLLSQGIKLERHSYSSRECDKAAVDLFNKSALDYLNKLIDIIITKTEKPVGIVLSSAWRERRTVGFLKELFRQHEFSKYLIDKTPEGFDSGSRGKQISKWLSDNQLLYNVVNFIVLDDCDNELSSYFPKQFVQCEHQALFGADEYEKALSIVLKNEPMAGIKQKRL